MNNKTKMIHPLVILSNFLRALILQIYSGVYIDLDYKILVNISNLIDTHDLVIGRLCHRCKRPDYINNAFISAAKTNPILRTVNQNCKSNIMIVLQYLEGILRSNNSVNITDAYN